MNFLRQCFKKLSSDRQTDRQRRPKLYTVPLRFAGGQLCYILCNIIVNVTCYSAVVFSSSQCLLSVTLYRDPCRKHDGLA